MLLLKNIREFLYCYSTSHSTTGLQPDTSATDSDISPSGSRQASRTVEEGDNVMSKSDDTGLKARQKEVPKFSISVEEDSSRETKGLFTVNCSTNVVREF